MSTATADSPVDQGQCLQLKGGLVPLTVLELHFFDTEIIKHNLQDKIDQAPGFFTDIPIVISLEKLTAPISGEQLQSLVEICQQRTIKPVALRGGSELLQEEARRLGLSLLPAAPPKRGPEKSEQTDPASKAEDAIAEQPETAAEAVVRPNQERMNSRVVDHPIRSGQQIYAPGGDLIILAPVSAGAEVLADGNIHVYGALRGRALAGVRGDTSARVFCQSLEAELVSISGEYKISEDLQGSQWKKAAQIRLIDDKLTVKAV